MNYKIVADSSCDVTKEMAKEMKIEIAPLTLEVDGVRYVDDETMDIDSYLIKANGNQKVPKSSCPSPDVYLEAMKGEEEAVFGITLSSELSGSYASAVLAKDLYHEDHKAKKIHIFDSKSAAAGEVAIAIYLYECIQKGYNFETVVEKVEEYIKEMATIFVLEKIDHLQKAGRMSKTKATIANVLNVKLILKANDKGEIVLHSQARGLKKAISKMIASFEAVGTVAADKIIVVAECQAEERAQQIKKTIQSMYSFREVIVVKTRGLSSNYTNSGGIVIAF